MSEKEFNILFKKYLQNQCNRKELNKLFIWLKDENTYQKSSQLIENFWKEIDDNLENKDIYDHDKILENIHKKLVSTEGSHPEYFKRRKLTESLTRETTKINWQKTIRIAATVTLLLGFSITMLILFNQKATNNVFNEINVPLGSKSQITLVDGTEIWLNAGSNLKYPQKFNKNHRTVYLSGEAFFEVAPRQKQSFVVKTSDIDIIALGTSFNVKSYPKEDIIETSLVEGLVSIKNRHEKNRKPLLLKPNQTATFVKSIEAFKKELSLEKNNEPGSDPKEKPDAANELLRLKKLEKKVFLSNKADIESNTSWKDNRLVFKNSDFETLCRKLERWYGVKIEIVDKSLLNYHYSGIIENETIHDVMRIISTTMPMEYKIEHAVIEIKQK